MLTTVHQFFLSKILSLSFEGVLKRYEAGRLMVERGRKVTSRKALSVSA